MNYRIEIEYETGGSRGLYITTDYLAVSFDDGLSWDDLEIAKENIKRIKEHWVMYDKSNSRRNRVSVQEVCETHKDERWFFAKKDKWFVDIHNKDREPKDWIIQDRSDKNVELWKDCRSEFRYDENACLYNLILVDDNGEDFMVSAFWCGYFESLISATIEMDDSELSFHVNDLDKTTNP